MLARRMRGASEAISRFCSEIAALPGGRAYECTYNSGNWFKGGLGAGRPNQHRSAFRPRPSRVMLWNHPEEPPFGHVRFVGLRIKAGEQ